MNKQGGAVVVLSATDLATLICLRPHTRALSAQLAHPHGWIARDGTDAALATLTGAALWCVAAWLGAGLLAAALGRAPGAVGRAGRAVAGRVLPGVVRRLVAGSAGLGMLLAPVTAAGGVAAPASAPAAVTAGLTTLPTPSWPVDPAPAPLPAPEWPAPVPPVPAPVPPHTHHRDLVRVRPGDSLWLIAARRLGGHPGAATVAAEWPRWYAANRELIGADPSLIRPGELLRPPDVQRQP